MPGPMPAGSDQSRSASGGATAGTVTDVIGHTLYVTTATGSLVKVEVGAATTIERTSSVALSSLVAGDTVLVDGTTGSGGVVTATRIAASAKGVASGTTAP